MKRSKVFCGGLAALALGTGALAAEPPKGPISIESLAPHTLQDWVAPAPILGEARKVARGPRVRGLPIADQQVEVQPFTFGGRTWTVDDYMRAYHTSGVIALRDGQVVFERLGLGRQPTDRWASMSVAKSVTSLLAGAAIRDHKLGLDDPIVRFVPELKGSAYDGVTVGQLLKMSSGVKWSEDYGDPASDNGKFYAMALAGGDPLIDLLKTLPRAHPPGSTWHYNTAETHLAGLVISRAVGMTLSDYLSEKIWKPYGMERDAYWALDRKGRELAGCCLSMTLADYARLGQFTLDQGVIDGRSVTAPDWVAQSTKVQIGNDRPLPFGYGYFWWIGPEAYEASGIYGQSILIYPKDRLVIAINSAWDKPDEKADFALLGAFQEAIRRAAMRSAPTP